MAWQEKYQEKIISAEQAAQFVKSGGLVWLPVGKPPIPIVKALAKRRGELRDVTIIQCYPAYPAPFWLEPGWEESFHVVTDYVSPVNRPGIEGRCVDFLPIDYPQYRKQLEGGRADIWSPDVFFGVISPPDEHGFCSFGNTLWYSKDLAKNAKLFIAEVDPTRIRTHGNNFIHVSEIDYLVEETEPLPLTLAPPPTEEEVGFIEVIGEQAASLVRDGDTIQIGIGAASERVPLFLEKKNDLGIHSEAIMVGMVELVKKRVVTGKYKTLHPGKAVTAMIAEAADLAFVHDNPVFELYSVLYINNVTVIAQQHNQVAINTALAIDFTGQVAAESLGPLQYSGLGGQMTFAMGAHYSQGGRSVHVLMSTARKGTVSRIVPHLPPGTVVSTPRTYVDYVVTEYGMANLQGKTVRQRAEALIEMAHPDFRPELRKEAKKLFWP